MIVGLLLAQSGVASCFCHHRCGEAIDALEPLEDCCAETRPVAEHEDCCASEPMAMPRPTCACHHEAAGQALPVVEPDPRFLAFGLGHWVGLAVLPQSSPMGRPSGLVSGDDPPRGCLARERLARFRTLRI